MLKKTRRIVKKKDLFERCGFRMNDKEKGRENIFVYYKK